MDYTETADSIVAVLDPGDPVMNSLEAIREQEAVSGAFFTGIGAIDRVTLGHFDSNSGTYTEKTFDGQFEVTAFSGNIGPDKIHAHIHASRQDFSGFGGHCTDARVSGTFEIIIVPIGTTLDHELDERTGIDVLELD